MKQVLIKAGSVIVEDVAAPQVDPKSVLVSTCYSCISVGTEMAGLMMSSLPLYRRALKQPQHVRRALEMARDQGLWRTVDRVRGKLSAGSPTGYSASGRILAVGSEVDNFAPGELVACAGAGYANHAEVINVPVNLCVRVPAGLGMDFAASVTLGAIAMQGVRRAHATLGETFVVVGLGILGQIVAQLLKANGCRVIGVEPDAGRVGLALDNGLDYGFDPLTDDYVERTSKLTDGQGCDGVIVTAASDSAKLLGEAMRACRRKGRVVLVGDVPITCDRADLYKKELDFFISTSYGPGRYDPVYEEGGNDYPLAYVRWTENRNMESYLGLLAQGRINLGNLFKQPYEIERASEAYESLKTGCDRPLLALLKYPGRSEARDAVVRHRETRPAAGKIHVALVGAASFAQGVHLPNMVKLRRQYELRCVVSRTGSTAKAVASQYDAAYTTTDYHAALSDPDIDLVFISTRHHLHAPMVLEALRAGKNVFVEKPLAVTEHELAQIEAFFERTADAPLLMTGYNRRFSPAIQRAKEALRGRTTPLIVSYRMNAGYIALDHWVHGPEGGGRNIGEACHIYDVFNFLVGALPARVTACAMVPESKQWARNDNFVATIEYQDGSICTLTYTALGNKLFPKERMEVFTDGRVISLDDYKALTVTGARVGPWKSKTADKGHLQELEALGCALLRSAPWPIPLEEQIEATHISFEVERQISARFGTAVLGEII